MLLQSIKCNEKTGQNATLLKVKNYPNVNEYFAYLNF